MEDKHLLDVATDPALLTSKHLTRLRADLRRLQAIRTAITEERNEGAGMLELKRMRRMHNDLAISIEKDIMAWYMWQMTDADLPTREIKQLVDSILV